jgi:putative transcriptional regulator
VSWSGRLLIATPVLDEPTFRRTVVLLLQHDEDGALGVVVNRPSVTPVDDVLPGWQSLAGDPEVVFEGGPVQRNAALCLGRGAVRGGSQPVPSSPHFVPLDVDAPVGTVDLDAEPDAVRPAVQQVRVFAGYAGWGAGQLEGEVEQGAWWVLDALPADAFSSQPEHLWRQVLRRQGGRLALFSTCPDDATHN